MSEQPKEPEPQVETRGGEEPFDWQVAVEVLQKTLNSRPGEVSG